MILRTAFTMAPILFGLDKFANLLVDWPAYLAPWINDLVPGSAQAAMYAVGVIEIVAGIIVNLLTIPDYYDIALRDFGLLLATVALARLAERYHGKRQR